MTDTFFFFSYLFIHLDIYIYFFTFLPWLTSSTLVSACDSLVCVPPQPSRHGFIHYYLALFSGSFRSFVVFLQFDFYSDDYCEGT